MRLTTHWLNALATLLFLPALIVAQPVDQSSPAELHRIADEYYRWVQENYPVASSDQGLHTWDNRVTDYSEAKVLARRKHVNDILSEVSRMQTRAWSKDDRIDWILFRSQLEGAAFFNRVMDPEATDPQVYVNEC